MLPAPAEIGRFLLPSLIGVGAFLVPISYGGEQTILIGVLTSFLGAYASYFLDGATGGIIVTLQTLLFLLAFVLAPKHGLLAARRRAAECL